MTFLIDHAARRRALECGTPECVHVPTAAIDEDAIRNYVGEILQILSQESRPRAFLVRIKKPPQIDLRFPIWDHAGSKILHQRMQVWVHIAYTRYRQAYQKAFPAEDIRDKVLSHTANRRIAALKGFQFVRITPTSRSANSSSAFSEGWGVALHGSPEQMAANRKRGAFIQYADLADLMLMLDMKLGGGIMDAVNEGQKLITPRKEGWTT